MDTLIKSGMEIAYVDQALEQQQWNFRMVLPS